MRPRRFRSFAWSLALAMAGMPPAVQSLGSQVADSAPPSRTRVLPVLGLSDSTGLQYGITAFRFFRIGRADSTRASSHSIYFAHTTKGYNKAFLQSERWSADNRLRLRGRLEYLSYPVQYFGIGSGTPESLEEWYSSGVTTLQLLAQQQVRGRWYALLGLRLTSSKIRKTEPGGQLAALAAFDPSATRVVQLQGGLAADSRDNVNSPTAGEYTRVIGSVASSGMGSEYTFARFTLDSRSYRPLRAGQVLAFQVQYDVVNGRVPFDQWPMIGADTAMRGYDRGRYRDRSALTAQLEYRSGYWRRAGVVAFAGVGGVSRHSLPPAGELLYPTVGAGLRALIAPRERGVARLDLGVGLGRRSVAINLGLGQAF